jgi:hypothetical protein
MSDRKVKKYRVTYLITIEGTADQRSTGHEPVGLLSARHSIEGMVMILDDMFMNRSVTVREIFKRDKPFKIPQNGCHFHMNYVKGCDDCIRRYPDYNPDEEQDD